MGTWFEDALFYHIYPLGLCGAPALNDGVSPPQDRLQLLRAWLPHVRALGANALYLGPVLESSGHGYDTTDYRAIDRRLGTNQEFRALVDDCHARGIRVVLDGVFNHVGRRFLAFKDLQARRERATGKAWFRDVRFHENNAYNDGFSYSAWHGCQDLVELNLDDPEVVDYLLGSVRFWIEQFDIDGIRLDAADCLPVQFIQRLRAFTAPLKQDFWLMGEVLHSAEYAPRTGDDRLHAVTNYELYKALHSSHNEGNYFEVAYSLNRMFGPGGILSGRLLYNFVDNHDVSRIASVLTDPADTVPLHILLFTVPGIPSIYYGSEFGVRGRKEDGDRTLRPCLTPDALHRTALTDLIARLAIVRAETPALRTGDYQEVSIGPRTFAFLRRRDREVAVVAVNNLPHDAVLELHLPSIKQASLADALDHHRAYTVNDGFLRLPVRAKHGAVLRGTL